MSLAARAGAGDRNAFAALYDRHAARVHAFCERTLDSPHDAADATQQAFLGLLRRLRAPGREPVAEPAAYLYASARNACSRIFAARGRVDVTDAPPEPAPDPGPSAPEVSVLVASQRADVRAANRRLPARQRQALALRELGELSYAEIGDILEVDANAVAQLLWRARLGLRAGVRRAALDAVAPLAPACERAHALVAAGQDGRAPSGDDAAFLDDHLAGCRRCQA
ncbi:MAG TPA: sigma-70 family RNA polymerase sigma factor, partial [Solirubrobacteraceae bacterium]